MAVARVSSVTIDGTLVSCNSGDRSWETIKLLNRGGQSLVYLAREVLPNDHIQELMHALRDSLGVGPPGPDNRGSRLAAAIQRIVELKAPHQYVVKVYERRPEQDAQESTQRFMEEVRVLTSHPHPRIVPIVDSGLLTDERRFLVQPFYERGSLAHCRDWYTGRPDRCLRALVDLLEGLVHLHQHQRIHRDIKPENILIGDDHRPVIADLGLVFAPDRQPSLTGSSERVGNWQYGPDWVGLSQENQRSPLMDLYGMAKVLWWMASGLEPLRREDWDKPEFDLVKRFQSVRGMDTINRILRKALASEPALMKYTTAVEMHDEVASLLNEFETGRSLAAPRTACMVCQSGRYERSQKLKTPELHAWAEEVKANDYRAGDRAVRGIDAYRCNSCGHIAIYATHRVD